MLFRCRASVEDCGSTLKHHHRVTCLRKVYSRPSDGIVLGQRHRRLTGIEPAMGCDAGPALSWNLIDRYGGPQVPPTLMQVQKHSCIFRNINASSEILMQVQKLLRKYD